VVIAPAKSTQHWYDRAGNPRHGATLREARKEGLLVSVSTVLKCWPADSLKQWLDGQLILAAATTPRLPNETDEAFVERVRVYAGEESKAAADVGTRRHELVERWLNGDRQFLKDDETAFPPDPDIPYIQPYLRWYEDNVERTLAAEQVIVNPKLGYAGKLDSKFLLRDGRTAVADLKNRKRTAVYATDAAQLSGYNEVAQADTTISIILGTTEPSILVKEWTPEERAEAWENFLLCLEIWKRSKAYWPERVKPMEAT